MLALPAHGELVSACCSSLSVHMWNGFDSQKFAAVRDAEATSNDTTPTPNRLVTVHLPGTRGGGHYSRPSLCAWPPACTRRIASASALVGANSTEKRFVVPAPVNPSAAGRTEGRAAERASRSDTPSS